jgi:hypothetical protein
MTSGDAESWARLRLVQGESSAQVWELVASAGQTTLTVGSGPSCNWVVREEGVAPVHFSLHWDGATLRVADTFGAGNVRVDGVPVAQQWRPLAGRVRVDFGRAAIVVEASSSSASSRPDAPHPLDPGSQPPPSSSAAPRANLKSTLIGVSPLAPSGAPPVQVVSVAPSGEPPAHTAPEHTLPADSFRPRRPSDSQRAAKPTLVGISVPPGGLKPPSAPASAPPNSPSPQSASAAPAPRSGVPAGTLMGMGLAEAMAQVQAPQRVGGSSLSDGDQRTMQGFPSAGGSSVPPPASQPNQSRRVTQAGVVSEAPGVSSGAVARAPVRTVSSPPPNAPEPVASRWQEGPGTAHSAEIVDTPPHAQQPVPQAVLLDAASTPDRRAPSPYAAGAPPGAYQSSRPRAERFSDAPTQMRDVGASDSNRPRSSGHPWAYVGIALLTALAYFAWLYLLDHL